MAKPESSPEEDVLPEAAADPKPAIVQVAATTTSDEPMSIPKPSKSTLDMFKTTRDPSIAGVETLLTALPHYTHIGRERLGAPAPGRGELLVGGIVFRDRADQGTETRSSASDQ